MSNLQLSGFGHACSTGIVAGGQRNAPRPLQLASPAKPLRACGAAKPLAATYCPGLEQHWLGKKVEPRGCTRIADPVYFDQSWAPSRRGLARRGGFGLSNERSHAMAWWWWVAILGIGLMFYWFLFPTTNGTV